MIIAKGELNLGFVETDLLLFNFSRLCRAGDVVVGDGGTRTFPWICRYRVDPDKETAPEEYT